jgi:hypothetical protein
VYPSVPGNRQNDHVWALNKSKVEAVEKSKFSPKIMVWGAMSATGLSQLHVFPLKQNVTARFYQGNILDPFLLAMLTEPVILVQEQSEDFIKTH